MSCRPTHAWHNDGHAATLQACATSTALTTNQEAIRRLARVMVDNTGNMPPLPGIFPDYSAPIVRNSDAGRELAMARWGMPTPKNFLMEATKKRAQKLEAKGAPDRFRRAAADGAGSAA